MFSMISSAAVLAVSYLSPIPAATGAQPIAPNSQPPPLLGFPAPFAATTWASSPARVSADAGGHIPDPLTRSGACLPGCRGRRQLRPPRPSPTTASPQEGPTQHPLLPPLRKGSRLEQAWLLACTSVSANTDHHCRVTAAAGVRAPSIQRHSNPRRQSLCIPGSEREGE